MCSTPPAVWGRPLPVLSQFFVLFSSLDWTGTLPSFRFAETALALALDRAPGDDNSLLWGNYLLDSL